MTETGNVTPGFKTDNPEAKRLRAVRAHHKKQSDAATATRASINALTDPHHTALKLRLDASIIYNDAMVAACETSLTNLGESWPFFVQNERYSK